LKITEAKKLKSGFTIRAFKRYVWWIRKSSHHSAKDYYRKKVCKLFLTS